MPSDGFDRETARLYWDSRFWLGIGMGMTAGVVMSVGLVP